MPKPLFILQLSHYPVTATPQCTALTIKKFNIGDTDQTTVAQANLYSGNDIVVDTDSLFGPFQPIPINRYLVRSNSKFTFPWP
ncbi:hypothetical protein N7467_003968 [Penicillium canescens]|nr:hypothetical protein N7467_003968 [Penicillium canescens]